jgi:hypothetical protein
MSKIRLIFFCKCEIINLPFAMTDTLNGRCRQIRTLTGKIQTHPQTLWKRFCPIFSYFWAEIFCWVKFYVEKKLATYFVPYTYVAYVIECRFSSSNWKVQSSCSILVSYSPISKIIDNKQLIISKIVCFAEGAICSEPTRGCAWNACHFFRPNSAAFSVSTATFGHGFELLF